MLAQTAAKPKDLLKRLHPRLGKWFRATYPAFTHAQLLCVPAILERKSILLTSPTGSGKTLAGFLGVFDFFLRQLDSGPLPPGAQCIYVSPLRALAYDIEKNLRGPIAVMNLQKELSIHLRTGDTTTAERTKFRRKGARFLVTTPESLAVMLAQESYAAHLSDCRFVIVDELHSFAGNKRGADLTISLERLERLVRLSASERITVAGSGDPGRSAMADDEVAPGHRPRLQQLAVSRGAFGYRGAA